MRNRLTRESLHTLMRELARSAKPKRSYRIYLVGGGTAVLEGWRESSIDADLYAKQDDIFRDVQDIKERLNLNIEFARPEDFVPPLEGSESRHVLIETVDRVSFYHYDPYAQLLSKVVRGFAPTFRCQGVRQERNGGSAPIQDSRARHPGLRIFEVPEALPGSRSGGRRRLPLEPDLTLTNPVRVQSCLSATTGSTRPARSAGTSAAHAHARR